MKPILFNTEMVRAILDGRKTVTRRVVKPQPKDHKEIHQGIALFDEYGYVILPRHKRGDILYVRETWREHSTSGGFIYKADYVGESSETVLKWKPSIHMPKEAARIFLRVAEARVERLQEITEEQAIQEGEKSWTDFIRIWNDCYAAPKAVKENGIITHYESYPFEEIRETRQHKGLPWIITGNPWVWVIEFERCEKPEGE